MSSTMKIKHKSRKELGEITWSLKLPPPPNDDPYQISITTDCANPGVSATLTPVGGGPQIPGAVRLGDPIQVSWTVPDGNYTLSVTCTCDDEETIITQEVTISAEFAKRKGKHE